MIPILIICFNNYKYVDMMVRQLEDLMGSPNITIINNNSTCIQTKKYLEKIKYNIINSDRNKGHRVWSSVNIYPKLPYRFIVTDPDLCFNKSMPLEFIDIMIKVSNKHKSRRVGLAVDISDHQEMLITYQEIEKQQQYWKKRIPDDEFELYEAPIDTSFCLISKHIGYSNNHIRIAGKFTMKHLPWYKEINFISPYERYMICKDALSKFSYSSEMELKYLEECSIIPIQMNQEYIMIDKKDHSIWSNNFCLEVYNILDNYLDISKQFLDIGASCGLVSTYAIKKSLQVVCVEADPRCLELLRQNMEYNRCNKYNIEDSIIYHTSGLNLAFGKDDNMNGCHIKNFKTLDDDVFMKTRTLGDIVSSYSLYNLSIIFVDIEGAEEFIMWDLSNYIGKVPLLVRFNYFQWRDKDLHRFSFLTTEHKRKIMANPFSTLLLF